MLPSVRTDAGFIRPLCNVTSGAPAQFTYANLPEPPTRPPPPSPPSDPWQAAGGKSHPVSGDLDSDGDADLVVGSSDGPLSIFINTGLIAAGGGPDCARPVFRLLEGNTDPFRGLEAWQLPDEPSVPSLGDLDGDGDLDLATGSSSGMPSFENQDGSGLPRFLPFSSARCGLEEVANPPSSPLNDYTSNLALEDACTGLTCNSWSVPLLAVFLTMVGLMVLVLAYVVLTQTSAKTGGAAASASASAARGIWIDGIWIDLGAAGPGSSSGYGTTSQQALSLTPNNARTRNEPPAIVKHGVMVDGIWIDSD